MTTQERKMKTYSICIETGPCAGDSYHVMQKARTLEDAIRLAGNRAKRERPWQHIMISQAACHLVDKTA